MKSLFVVSLPRSLSTHTCHLARVWLGLQSASWASEGEIINFDRLRVRRGPSSDEGKFATRDADPEFFQQLLDFLDQVTVREGFVYKDVVQPFVVAAWQGLADFRVLRIKREIADVTYSMLRNGWYYPRVAATIGSATTRPISPLSLLNNRRRDALVREIAYGLLRADTALDTIQDIVTITYHDLVTDVRALPCALQHLYPKASLPTFDDFPSNFKRDRDHVAARRTTPEYRWVEGIVQECVDASTPARSLRSERTSADHNRDRA